MNANTHLATSRPPLYLLALLGRDIQGSLSPQLYELEARRQGLRCSYQLLDFTQRGWGAEALPDVLRSLETLGFTGCNVTHPFKQQIIPYLDQLSPQASAIGAVNTVLFRHGQRIGHNTDCPGFISHFRRHLADVNIERVLQVGAGGAGSASAYGLLEYGVKHLALYDRDTARSEALYQQLLLHFGPERISITDNPQQALADSSGLVQATPIGMSGHPGVPINLDWLTPHHWVADVIYVPRETELVLRAREKGCRAIGGDGMVVFQAAQAFELYTGLPPDREHMLEIFQQVCVSNA
ncbi:MULTISPECIES: shikimate dehydrogenase [unclassified Serratia (in: enterobacteria)]|uniref:shikimate dehydrogenase n=1 Tax=unclassified Serratia (in: enterobacteria) TaxID=2647522 RepID=UPI000502A5A5|nr:MULTISPECIES: shikimate dehydrogenase [unclassified Serratia (in: enterobacteria)]KFK94400.1 shikimate dehydrogenase [Serratia sp. Ag2]KFK99475.1 shikimate dehydrogenase [Serratia sp. Ag1]